MESPPHWCIPYSAQQRQTLSKGALGQNTFSQQGATIFKKEVIR
jgi:hypothetical protein